MPQEDGRIYSYRLPRGFSFGLVEQASRAIRVMIKYPEVVEDYRPVTVMVSKEDVDISNGEQIGGVNGYFLYEVAK